MNLLERLQQGQTLLSAGSFPNDAPINDPQSGFIQSNLPDSTYEDETLGQPNNGSVLVNTLDNTALDNINPSFNTPTFPPATNNNYPELASGEFNGAPSQYEPLYNANNTYLDNLPIQDDDSPQLNTLGQTGLDNTNNNAEPTSVIPNSISYPNNYPPLVSGKFDGAPEQYDTPYNLDNTYLEDVPIKDSDSPQIPTLSEINPPTPWSAPTIYPGNALGKWRGPSTNFVAPWSYGFPYDINLFNNLSYVKQQDTLDKTSLDNTIPQSISTTNPIPNSNSYPNNYPALVSGEFNNAPSQYSSPYNPDNTYLDVISIQDSNSPQNFSLANTGLDNTNPLAAPSAIIPNDISYPNNYPTLVSGEFNGAPSQYTSPYNSENPYLNSIPIQDPNSPQIPTLGETGLDLNDAPYAQTAIVPNSTTYPNIYPALPGVNLSGIGAPKQYSTNWRQNNDYLTNFGSSLHSSLFGFSNLDNASSTISSPLISNQIDPQDAFNIIFASSLTGADTSVASNTPPPVTSTSPTNYPALEHVYLGEFNGAPSQYNTIYNASNTYLQKYNIIVNPITNPQTNTLDETGLDVENSDALPTSLLFAPTNPDDITTYPTIAGINLGVTGSGAQGFNQVYKPSNTYWDNYLTNRSLFDTLTA
jgi:hypothetical protein